MDYLTMNYNNSVHQKRKTTTIRQSKDNALYGIFAYNSSSDDENPSFKKKRKVNNKEEVEVKVKFDEDFSDVAKKKGIGMKLLEKMGYKGGGLGKDEQGIVNPIEVKLRPKYMGMGYNGYEERRSVTRPVEEQPQVEEDTVLWKKQALMTDIEVVNENVPMAELMYNVGLVVQLAELDVERIGAELRVERERAGALREERGVLYNEVVDQEEKIEAMMEVLKVVDSVEEANACGKLTLECVVVCFNELRRRFPEEYRVCDLSWIACSFGFPLLVGVFEGWDPLEDPSHGVDVMSMWKGFLEGDDEGYGVFEEDEKSPYSQLLAEVVFPIVRTAGMNSWEVKDPEPMICFLGEWEDLLTPSVLHSLLDIVVLPKLLKAVNSWEPSEEEISIHLWVHPWLPWLGNQRLDILLRAIHKRLGFVLKELHPRDNKSACSFLLPWKPVLGTTRWEQLIAESIFPKLLEVVKEIKVDHAKQNLDLFDCIMAWASVVPIHQMINLLEFHFFTKWRHFLHQWLCTTPDFDEVYQWYCGWKMHTPETLLDHGSVRLLFVPALKMIEQAAEAFINQLSVKDHLSYWTVREQKLYEVRKAVKDNVESVVVNLKDIIEAFAQQHGLLFKPKPGRVWNHHQIYSFGTVSIIFDSVKQEIFAQVLGEWSLVTLTQLLMQNIYSTQ